MQQKVLAKLQNIFSQFRISLTAAGFSMDAFSETNRFDVVDQVFNAFNNLAELAKQQKKEDRLIADLEKLASKQQDILIALAIEPTGQNFISVVKAPASSITQMIKTLLNKDMVYKVSQLDDALPQLKQGQFRVLDPLLAYALRQYA